eukprot:jgi/Tetstr1/442588/TSEL_030684.t1
MVRASGPGRVAVTPRTQKRALHFVLLLLLGVNLAEVVVAVLSPCPFFDVIKGTGPCRADINRLHYTSLATLFLGMLVLTYTFLTKMYSIYRLRVAARLLGRGQCQRSLDADHWVVGATRSFFLETAAAVKAARGMTVLLQVAMVVLAIARIAPVVLQRADPETAASVGNSVPALCLHAETYTFLCASQIWRRVTLEVAWTLLGMPLTTVLSVPSLMWAPITEEAVTRFADTSLRRMIAIPWLLILPTCLNTFLGLAYFTMLWTEDGTNLRVFRQVSFGLTVFSINYGLVLLIWSRLLQDAAAIIRDSDALAAITRAAQCGGKALLACMTCQSANGVSRLQRFSTESQTDLYPDGVDAELALGGTDTEQSLRQDQATCHGLATNSERGASAVWDTSVHHQQLVALYSAVYFMCSPDGTSIYSFVTMYIVRFIAVGTFLLTRDTPCRMDDLHEHGAGLGLVMAARPLARAIHAHLRGAPFSEEVPTFKATVLRMHRTMAVSYRWQERSRDLNDDISVNMSNFQMRTLVDAIFSSGCEYVWIDKVSVPQERSELQSKLLSRMLAVYSSALLTLAIRGAEEHQDNRYHRRCWTVQEFCCARRLQIETEEAPPGSGLVAVEQEEERYFLKLRGEVQTALSFCKPYWLREPGVPLLSEEQAADIIRRYRLLAGRTHCQNHEDKLRALCPLLANIPVESHEELLELLDHIAERAPGEILDGRGEDLLKNEKANYAYQDIVSKGVLTRRRSGRIKARRRTVSALFPTSRTLPGELHDPAFLSVRSVTDHIRQFASSRQHAWA